MKYIKIFEQMDEENWLDEESPFDQIRDLKIVWHYGEFYLQKEIKNNKIYLFNNDHNGYPISIFNLNPKFDIKKNKILILDYSGIRSKEYYEDLPKEIKDRIII